MNYTMPRRIGGLFDDRPDEPFDTTGKLKVPVEHLNTYGLDNFPPIGAAAAQWMREHEVPSFSQVAYYEATSSVWMRLLDRVKWGWLDNLFASHFLRKAKRRYLRMRVEADRGLKVPDLKQP